MCVHGKNLKRLSFRKRPGIFVPHTATLTKDRRIPAHALGRCFAARKDTERHADGIHTLVWGKRTTTVPLLLPASFSSSPPPVSRLMSPCLLTLFRFVDPFHFESQADMSSPRTGRAPRRVLRRTRARTSWRRNDDHVVDARREYSARAAVFARLLEARSHCVRGVRALSPTPLTPSHGVPPALAHARTVRMRGRTSRTANAPARRDAAHRSRGGECLQSKRARPRPDEESRRAAVQQRTMSGATPRCTRAGTIRSASWDAPALRRPRRRRRRSSTNALNREESKNDFNSGTGPSRSIGACGVTRSATASAENDSGRASNAATCFRRRWSSSSLDSPAARWNKSTTIVEKVFANLPV